MIHDYQLLAKDGAVVGAWSKTRAGRSYTLSGMNTDLIADFQCHCGEGPLWHPDRRELIWTDIPTGRLFRYDPATGASSCFYDDQPVGGFTVQADGQLLVFRDKGNVVTLDPHTGHVTGTVIDELPDEIGTRFNDVIADPRGRVFCGTMPVPEGKPTGPRQGRLYRLDTDGSIHHLLSDIGCSNGMAFILGDGNDPADPVGMYYIDTPTQRVDRFDYDVETGAITGRRMHADLSEIEGSPDGMTVDDRGELFVALWGGWGIAHFDAAGQYLHTLKLKAKCVTCPIFAPSSTEDNAPLDTLYITSAMAHEKPSSGEHAGALFGVKLGRIGRPEHRSRVGL